MRSTAQQFNGRDAPGRRTGVAQQIEAAAERVDEIAHDMRTPLAIILGLCERLDHAQLDAAATADLGRVRANAQRLASDVDELVALRSEEHVPASAPRPVDVSAIVWAVTADLRVIATSRSQRLSVDAKGAPTVAGHDDELRALVTNLITNALRSAPPGGLVRCSVLQRGWQVQLEVADDGPGIPPDERDHVLRRFARGAAADEADGGVGLGLAIVKRIVDRHRGRLTIDDAPEGGALFRVELPAVPRTRADRRPAAGMLTGPQRPVSAPAWRTARDL